MSSPLKQAGKTLTVKETVIFAILAAMMIGGQAAMASLPNIEPVSLFIIVTAAVYGYKALYPTYVFVLAEGLIYGFSMWYICYLYIWAILVLLTVWGRKSRSPLFWAILSGTYGLFFGALAEIPYLFIIGPRAALLAWISGIPFDIMHCVGNFVIALVFAVPLIKLLSKLRQDYH